MVRDLEPRRRAGLHLSAGRAQPGRSSQVTADVEGLTVPRGDYQPVPLTVVRTDYAGPIALTLAGAPPGVTLTPSEIPAGVDAIVCKLAAAADAPLGVYSPRILARPAGQADAPRSSVRTRPLIDRQLVNVDLIPYALREDQRRLPPSLTDRLAAAGDAAGPVHGGTAREAGDAGPLPARRLSHRDHAGGRFRRADHVHAPAAASSATSKNCGRVCTPNSQQATPAQPKIVGSVHSRILANLGKTRIDVEGVGVFKGRRVALTRTFDLDLRTAFAVSCRTGGRGAGAGRDGQGASAGEPRADVRRRRAGAPVENPRRGAPESVVIPHGQPSVEVELKAAPDAAPTKKGVQLSATGLVDKFEEEQPAARSTWR